MKKEMLINVLQPEECRIAIIEDGVLEELYVERTSHESYTGNIYKGKIVNLEPAIQAAFVDFSVGRNGFLHVSDVEPQYYQRQTSADASESVAPRDGRRDRDRVRDDRRRGRSGPGSGAGSPDELEERDPRLEERPRERPDRSERGRRDRSEPRRFGEGLTEEDWSAPAKPSPIEPIRDEPRRAWTEVSAPPSPVDQPAPQGSGLQAEGHGHLGSLDEPGSRSRIGHVSSLEPFDPDLPPSRTQRSRTVSSAHAPELRSPDLEAEAGPRSRNAAPSPPRLSEVERPADLPVDREPRRGRGGRNRPRRPLAEPPAAYEPETELPHEFLTESDLRAAPEPGIGFGGLIEVDEPEFESEPIHDDRESRELPRRRGKGRAAIRSRGGEREALPERPRPLPSEHAPALPPLPAGEFPTSLEPEAEKGRDRGRSRDRAREGDRARGVEPESPRERPTRPHDRAGEPGYVPRRERSRGPGTELPALWSDLGAVLPEPDLEAETEPAAGPGERPDAGSGPDQLEGPRRRRRRRGRRRDRERDRFDVEADAKSPTLEEEGDLDFEDEPEDRPRLPRTHERESKLSPAPLLDEFDFGDEAEVAELVGDAGIEELRDEKAIADEAIDPELEEEIRREIEEIAELEREMGLRGPVEARPRRGEDRERSAEQEAEGGRGGRHVRGRGLAKPPIQEVFRRGDEVLVQVIKESIGTKGPTLSTYISIPGRYLVLMPGLNRVGVSRKIADESQRRKLREIMNELNPPKGLGFIVRTAGLERTKRELARDLAYLLRLWKVILRRIKKSKAPAAIYQESDMITRTIRDIFTAEIDTIWIDEPAAFERAQEFLRVVMPRYVNRLRLYDEKVPLFHKYGIEDEIAKIQRRHVPLPEGGSIVIDQTEALVAIDVNSGNFRVENDAERTAYEMNLRAAKEIARQLPAPQPGRRDRQRLHRHARGATPTRCREGPAQRDQARPGPYQGSAHERVRPDRDDPPTHPPQPEAIGLRGLRELCRRRCGQDRREHVDRCHAPPGPGRASRGYPSREYQRSFERHHAP